MTKPDSQPSPSVWPATLAAGEVKLRFVELVPADPTRGLVSYFHFRILTTSGADVGHINFRVGETEHILLYAGNIGFVVNEASRGNGYALHACRAIAPFVRSVCDAVIITCDPDNVASRRTIERLGAHFLDEVAVPPEDPQYERGSRSKRRYRWMP
jgi:predicted acetyltransferase